MGSNLDKLRKAAESFGESGENIKDIVSKETTTKIVADTKQTKSLKKTTKYFSMEIMLEDWTRLEAAMGKLSNRDNTIYKRKDIYIAMSKYFLDAVENNIDKIKVEKL